MSRPKIARTWAVATIAGLAAAAFVPVAPAGAARNADKADSSAQSRSQGNAARSAFSAQHGSTDRHLAAKRENVELVGKLSPTRRFGNVVPEQIADVTVHKNFAYLMSWSEATCTRGGVYVVDISDPTAPKEGPFIPALANTYHGEGAHALSVRTSAFTGDLLAVNNEPCNAQGDGGFDLYDVSNPNDPKTLVQGFGDVTGTGDDAFTNDYHSVFVWQSGNNVFLVAVDNVEATDVDIFDITNPRAPVMINDLDLVEAFPAIFDDETLGATPFHHDVVVEEIGGRQIMMASYWDAGYVKLDVTDPTAVKYLGDTTFAGGDPFRPSLVPPEGNAHQGEFSFDNRYFLAADEDFAPYRVESFVIETGEHEGTAYPAVDVGGGTSPAYLPDGVLNGPVVYGGYGCPDPDGAGPESGSPAVPQRSAYDFELDRTEEAIMVLSRGPTGDPSNPQPTAACFPGEKAATAKAAGWDAVVLVNRHFGDAESDSAYCGSGVFPAEPIVTTCTTHTAFHHMFDDEPNYDSDYTPNSEPAIGAEGERIRATPVFDGWGYAHLYENNDGKMREIDQYAIQESQDERYAFSFGDLSIHEWATDPTERLAYAAYYAGGFRTVAFGPEGIAETGAFIDEGGNNFWGVEQFTSAEGERLIALSDRDFGLYIVKYVGPGAAKPPFCQDQIVRTNVNDPVRIQLTCTDANNNPMLLELDTLPGAGSIGGISGTALTYTPRAGFRGVDTFTFRATDGASLSNVAKVEIQVGRCTNRILGTPATELINGTIWHDAILGGRGNDTVDAGAGDDCVAGEAGNDQLTGGDGKDELTGGTGTDRLFGDSDNDTLRGNGSGDHLRGGSGNDRLRGDDGRDFLGGGSNNDVLVGGAGVDSLRGESGNDRIYGDAGNDIIDLGAGADRVSAGSGNDRINAADGTTDRISCGTGRDLVRADRRDRVARSCERVLRTRTTRRG
jgi:hypothetical protein